MIRTGIVLILLFIVLKGFSEAALYVDDTSTTDKGHFEFDYCVDYYKDIETEYDFEAEEHIKAVSKETDFTLDITYGLRDNWDISVTAPYAFINDSSQDKVNGFCDFAISTKYRLWAEKKILPSYALSFEFKTDSANEEKGLGTGKNDYALNNIFTKNFGPNVVDLNLGYVFVGSRELDNIFFYIFDFARDLTDKINVCSEIYGETTFKGDFDDSMLCGALSFSYELNKIISFESGIGIGITKASPDYQFSSTITFSF
jgi:hypothetical protein